MPLGWAVTDPFRSPYRGFIQTMSQAAHRARAATVVITGTRTGDTRPKARALHCAFASFISASAIALSAAFGQIECAYLGDRQPMLGGTVLRGDAVWIAEAAGLHLLDGCLDRGCRRAA